MKRTLHELNIETTKSKEVNMENKPTILLIATFSYTKAHLETLLHCKKLIFKTLRIPQNTHCNTCVTPLYTHLLAEYNAYKNPNYKIQQEVPKGHNDPSHTHFFVPTSQRTHEETSSLTPYMQCKENANKQREKKIS